mmetsp:Transcript_6828/g.12936  ORF Transcript_6828/g.12936 Transcript_6828/m.12936 type:complete len:205 (-) Transcript_6828:1961-2575(-)
MAPTCLVFLARERSSPLVVCCEQQRQQQRLRLVFREMTVRHSLSARSPPCPCPSFPLFGFWLVLLLLVFLGFLLLFSLVWPVWPVWPVLLRRHAPAYSTWSRGQRRRWPDDDEASPRRASAASAHSHSHAHSHAPPPPPPLHPLRSSAEGTLCPSAALDTRLCVGSSPSPCVQNRNTISNCTCYKSWSPDHSRTRSMGVSVHAT